MAKKSKAPVKKVAPKKASVKKMTAKKGKTKGIASKKAKAPVKKMPVKKVAPKKVTAKKSVAPIKKATVPVKSTTPKKIATKKVAVKKSTAPVKKVAVQKPTAPAKPATKKAPVKPLTKPSKIQLPAINPEIPASPFPSVELHGEDLHLIPKVGEQHPITTLEAHEAEKKFHQREEVALHQENKKVKQALSKKNAMRFNRFRGKN